MKFNYQARTKTGEVQTGVIEATSRESAISLLQKYGFYVTFLEEIEVKPIYAKKIKFFERISGKDIVMFARHLSIMFRSRVPLLEALQVLASQTKNLIFREKILEVVEAVEGGTSLSGALSEHPKLFSPFFISIVKSGEASGKLSEGLEYLANHLEREYHLTSKMRGALIYPALVLLLVLVVTALIFFFVVPQLMPILKETGQELPLVTQIMVKISDFLINWGWILILAFLGLIVFIFQYIRTSEGKKVLDKFFLKIPVISSFLKMVYLSRFAENLSTLISGGLPIARALEISGEVVGNSAYQEVILRARDGVRKGESISSILGSDPNIFPPVFTQMTLVGEKTGTLDQTLMNIVSFYQKEVDRATDNLLSIIEPVLVIFLGLIVAGLMASVLLPLYQMASF